MATRSLLYAESDGQVYLVRGADGRLTFPSRDDRVPFSYTELHRTRVHDADVHFVRPRLDRHPTEWVYKDAVPSLSDVDPLVRQAINASLARFVVGALVRRPDGKVLMVKSARGFTKGMWNVPGGFVEYGEHPEAAIVRELREEVGLEIDLGHLIGVYMERFESPYFMYGFMYDATVAQDADVRPAPDEIAQTAWMHPDDATRSTRNPFARAALGASAGG